MKPPKKLQPKETMNSVTQKANDSGNKADKSLATLMSGKVMPSYGKKVTRPTGANKDRRNK